MKLKFFKIFVIFCVCFFMNSIINLKATANTQYIKNVPVNVQQQIQKYGAILFYKKIILKCRHIFYTSIIKRI